MLQQPAGIRGEWLTCKSSYRAGQAHCMAALGKLSWPIRLGRSLLLSFSGCRQPFYTEPRVLQEGNRDQPQAESKAMWRDFDRVEIRLSDRQRARALGIKFCASDGMAVK